MASRMQTASNRRCCETHSAHQDRSSHDALVKGSDPMERRRKASKALFVVIGLASLVFSIASASAQQTTKASGEVAQVLGHDFQGSTLRW